MEDLEALLFAAPIIPHRDWNDWLKRSREEKKVSAEISSNLSKVQNILPRIAKLIREFEDFQVHVTATRTLFFFRKGSHATEAVIPNKLIDTEEAAYDLLARIVLDTEKEYRERGY